MTGAGRPDLSVTAYAEYSFPQQAHLFFAAPVGCDIGCHFSMGRCRVCLSDFDPAVLPRLCTESPADSCIVTRKCERMRQRKGLAAMWLLGGAAEATAIEPCSRAAPACTALKAWVRCRHAAAASLVLCGTARLMSSMLHTAPL